MTAGMIIGIIFGVIILVIVIGMLVLKLLMGMNTKVLKPDEIIIANGDEDKKALVLYQRTRHNSATDITMALADTLHDRGYRVVVNHPSVYINYNPDDYDLLVFGSGVYGGNIANVLKAYMANVNFNRKDVILYVVGSDKLKAPELALMESYTKGAKKVKSIKVTPGSTDEIKDFIMNF